MSNVVDGVLVAPDVLTGAILAVAVALHHTRRGGVGARLTARVALRARHVLRGGVARVGRERRVRKKGKKGNIGKKTQNQNKIPSKTINREQHDTTSHLVDHNHRVATDDVLLQARPRAGLHAALQVPLAVA